MQTAGLSLRAPFCSPTRVGRQTGNRRASICCRAVATATPSAPAAAPSEAAAAPSKTDSTASKRTLYIEDDKFKDYRWVGGRWNLDEFKTPTGEMDWDAVIDAETGRRKLLEESPVASINEEPVLFDTAEIPWWAWVKRFHLPEAEKLNGRACMVGYALAWVVDSLVHVGLVDQQDSFLGKVLLHLTVFGVLLFRTTDALPKYKGLLEEATFYDKQWSATWEGQERPTETEK